MHATMTVTPSSALEDLPVSVRVAGLPAGARTTVTATATDTAGVPWTSSADFAAAPDGTVSLAQKPLSGYPAADPMALFELMTPARGSAVFFAAGQTHDVTLRAGVGGKVVAEATAHRRGPFDAGVRGRDLRPATDGVYGTLYRPGGTSTARRPALVVFGGSEGGLSQVVVGAATLLAAEGYPTLALAYFGEPGLPATLTDVPLEYFAKALTLLRAQPGVDPRHVLVQGTSRGGEAALLLGATYPDLVNGVVAGVPSSRVQPSPGLRGTAWTLHGRRLPAGEEIRVERIRGPVLLNCGGQDGVWPSCLYLEGVRTRLALHHFAHPVTALEYPEGGHYVGIFTTSYTSWTPAALDLQPSGENPGGTLPATLAGAADSHAKLLALLSSL